MRLQHKGGRWRLLPKILMSAFVLTMLGGLVGGGPAVADGENDRITQFINLAKNSMEDNDGKIDMSKLKQSDAQFLGVFMSNFFVPYTTELGYSDGKSEATKNTKAKMKELLGTMGIGDPDNQTMLADYVFEQSRNTTTKDLMWFFSDKGPADVTDADMVPNKNTPNTVYNLQKMVGGKYLLGYGSYEPCNGELLRSQQAIRDCGLSIMSKSSNPWTMGAGSDPDVIYNQGKHFAYLASPDKKKIAFSTDVFMRYTTPSMIAFANSSKLVDPKLGFGTSLFDFSIEDVKNDALESDNLYESSIFSIPVQVDSFGNLISMGPNHQYIMMPGAMNPYTWQAVDDKGDENPKLPVGSALNLMNFPMISSSATGAVVNTCNEAITACTINANIAAELKNAVEIKVPSKDDYPNDDKFDPNKEGNMTGAARIWRGSEEFRMRDVKDAIGGGIPWIGKNGTSTSGQAFRKVLTDFMTNQGGRDASTVMSEPYHEGGGWNTGGVYNQAVDWMTLPYFGDHSYSFPKTSGMGVFTKGAAFDVNGEFGGDDKSAIETMVKDATLPILDTAGKLVGGGEQYESKSSAFINSFKDSKVSGQLVDVTLDATQMQTIYYTYLMAMDWGSESPAAKELNGALGYRISSDNLPSISTANFEFSDEAIEEMQDLGIEQRDEDIRNWTWYLLNPSQGFEYVTSLVTNKTTSFLMNTHADIVGATNAPAVAGSTKYLGFSGYVTMPELTDLPWTDSVMKWYNSNWMYISLGMIIILGFYALTGVITLQKAIGGAVIFAILAMVPANLINYTVNTSNRVTNAIYGEKFTYWALLQNQSYAQAIEAAAGEDNYNDYLRKQMAANSQLNITGIQGGSGQNSKGQNSVVLKWQAPKKMVTLMASEADQKMNQAAEETGSDLLKQGFGGLQDAYSGESYLEGDSVYMYRSYIDLSNFSRFIYRGFKEGKQSVAPSVDTSKWPESLRNSWDTRNSFAKSVTDGYNVGNGASDSVEESTRIMKPLSSKIVADTFGQASKMGDLTQKDYLGIDTRAFNFSIKPFNDGTSLTEGVQKTTKNLDGGPTGPQSADSTAYGNFDPTMGAGYTDKDYAGLAAYGVMSESPFYYFSWNLYDQGMSVNVGDNSENGKGKYKDILLGDDGRSYFYNVKGNDEMKDFADMKSMFTYTIPYMKAGNNVVRQFDQVFGLKYEKGIPTTEGYGDNPEIKNNPEMQQKYWKNLNISRLYSIYSPWVDLMYGTSYSEPETVMYQGEKITISDPIDPGSYPVTRPMVFSKSEQADWGLNDDQLTQVERKIQEVESNSQKKMYGLLNAYNYDDNVLVTAAAMNTTFEFNKAFSESKLFGDNIQLYPQSYELKNFSYDAFLRLILSNSTGDSISGQSATDFYTGIVQKSSMFTAGVLLANDVVSSYAIPAAKVFGLVAVFVTAILMLVASCIRIEEDLVKNLVRSLVLPLLGLLSIFVGMALVVSWFMSSGNTAVTGYDGVSISLGDPVMVLLAMLAINCVVLFALYKLFRYMIGNVMRYGKGIGSSIGAVIKGSGSAVKSLAQGQGLQAARSAAGVTTAVGAGASMGGVDRGDGRISGEAMERMNRGGGGTQPGQIGRNTEGIQRPSAEDPKPKARTFNDDDVSSDSVNSSGRLGQVVNSGQSRVRSDSSQSEDDPFLAEGDRRAAETQKGSRKGYFSGKSESGPETEAGKPTEVAPEAEQPKRKQFDFDGF